MSESSKIKVGIFVGDPNGIGFEIILKTFQEKKLFKKFIPIAFAHPQNFFEESEKYKLDTNIIEVKNIGDIQENFLNVIDIWDNPFPINYGKDELTAGNFAFSSFERYPSLIAGISHSNISNACFVIKSRLFASHIRNSSR